MFPHYVATARWRILASRIYPENRKRSASLVPFSRRSLPIARSRSRYRSRLEPLRHQSDPTSRWAWVPDVFRADCRIGHGGAGVFATALQHAVHT